MNNDEELSHTFPKTIEGMRVAVAGLPLDMNVIVEEEVQLTATCVRELKSISRLPHPVEVIVPFRLRHDSKVRVRRLPEQ